MNFHALRSLAQHAVAQDCTLSLRWICNFDWIVKCGTDAEAIVREVDELGDMCVLHIRNAAGEEVGVAHVMPTGEFECDAEECVADYRGAFIDAWWKAHFIHECGDE